MEYCASVTSMLAEEIWQIVEKPENLAPPPPSYQKVHILETIGVILTL